MTDLPRGGAPESIAEAPAPTATLVRDEPQRVRWGNDLLGVEISWSDTCAPSLSAVRTETSELVLPGILPLVEILAAGRGHRPANDRLVHTSIGEDARYVSHTESRSDGWSTLTLLVKDEASGAEAELLLAQPDGVGAIRASVAVRNAGATDLVLRSVASFTSSLGLGSGDGTRWRLHHGDSDWLAEGRWTTTTPGDVFPDLAHDRTGHDPRGEFSVVSTGTWSTGKHLPVAIAAADELPVAWAWQIEHNGPWRWEVGRDSVGDYVSLSGPTHTDHNWLRRLAPGESVESVPVAVTVASDPDQAVARLTAYRRSSRRPHPDNERMPVIFNDYMNTLDGDPTTEKLLPLIDAAADAGAEVFCVDAGWYDDSGDWWDSVGEWRPSVTRFPGGLGEVIDRIRSRGMVPGLWLEPEVVGVNSPLAVELPETAFLRLAGTRLVEHHRYHLDLRDPAARAHLDGVVDRLIADFGIGYFKLDYNINPGTGSDTDADSTGAALLDHNRAHLAWLDGVLDRHPGLVLENCGSGAMRSDWAMMSRMQLQSTSDQQDPVKYPPIAASAPMAMLPEQAANWAYPQPGMSAEETAFCLVTGLAGRFFLSGYLNNLDEERFGLVREAVALAKTLRTDIRVSTPFWPLGLPGWDDGWVALGLDAGGSRYLAVWNRDPETPSARLALGRHAVPGPAVDTIFPRSLEAWETRWDEESGTLHVRNTTGSVGARMFRLAARQGDQPTETP